jgi:hypothetical protein
MRTFRFLLLIVLLGLFQPANIRAQGGASLRFFGTGSGDIDRVKIALTPLKPSNVAGDFTIEWWMKALPGENTSNVVNCNANDGWIFGNIIFDRDVYGAGDYGDFGIALTNGRIAFGVSVGASGNTICGATNVADGAWHHVAVTRVAASGQLRIFVDGGLDAQGSGAAGDVSYRDGRATSYPNSDPFLVLAAEKHDAGAAYPSYSGWLDEVRVSNSVRYAANFVRPSAPFAADANAVALYHFDEGAGNTLNDTSGASGGPSHGVIRFGGTPTRPEWSTDTPWTMPRIFLPLVLKQ